MKKLEFVLRVIAVIILFAIILGLIFIPFEKFVMIVPAFMLFYALINAVCAVMRLMQKREYGFWGFCFGTTFFSFIGLFIHNPTLKIENIFVQALVFAAIISLYGLVNVRFKKNTGW